MGFGDNEPPALRADPFPATLQGSGGFKLLILTFISWDVLKISVSHAGQVQHIQIDATGKSTDFVFRPANSGQLYSFVAKGCARALDGSTNRCSPESEPVQVLAATNTNSLKEFLIASGVSVTSLRTAAGGSLDSLRSLMGLEE
jgi:hypothetical protein